MKSSKSFRSLKAKIIAMSMTVVATLGISAFLVVSHLAAVNKETAKGSYAGYTGTLADAIAAQFYERYGDVQAFAMNPVILSGDKAKIVQALDAYSALYGIYDLIMLVDAKGQLVAVNSKGPDGKDIPSAELYKKSYADEPWFKSTMAGELTEDKDKGFTGTFVEDVQLDAAVSSVYGGNRLGSSFSAPVKDAAGKTLGVVTNRAGSRWFEVAFKELSIAMKRSHINQAELMLLSKDGTLLFESTPDSRINDKGDVKYDWNSLLKYNLVKAGSTSAKAAIERGSGAVTQLNTRTKKELLAGYGPVQGPKFVDKVGWSVLVRDDYHDAMGVFEQAEFWFHIIFAATLAFACALSYWFSDRLAKSLRGIATSLSEETSRIAHGATTIADSSSELSEAVTEQAAAIQETAASIDQVSAMSKKSADNAGQAIRNSHTSRDAAERGQKAVTDMIGAIDEISRSNAQIMNQVETGNRQIADIVKVIADIETKTKVINDIVFQTKLLSFNASVEAARAGEHGKGFAVVAEEVGNLAQMSGNAAKEISSMLEASINKVQAIVQETGAQVGRLIGDGKAKVEAGTTVARRCGEALENILASVNQVNGMVEEISSASREQSQGVSEVNKAMNQLDQVTQQNSQIAQSSASTAETLSEESRALQALVAQLMNVVEGPGAAAAPGNHANGGVVVPLRRKHEPTAKREPNAMRMAAGAPAPKQPQTPASDDPRFEDI